VPIDISPARKPLNRLLSLLLLAVGLLGLHLGWQTMADSVETQSWPYVEGTVIESHLAPWTLGGYRPFITYRFDVNDHTYYGRSFYASHFRHLPIPTRKMGEKLLAPFSSGASVNVYFNPADPQHCLVEPCFAWWGIFPLFGGTLLLLAGGFNLRKRDARDT